MLKDVVRDHVEYTATMLMQSMTCATHVAFTASHQLLLDESHESSLYHALIAHGSSATYSAIVPCQLPFSKKHAAR